MDLGFGSANHQVGSLTAQALIQGTKAQEAAVQDEMERYDALLNDEDAIAAVRARRIQEMKQAQSDQQTWRSLGHGKYHELAASQQDSRDVAKAFFGASRESERLVVHFYRPSTPLCDIFHKHLEKLAYNHLETRFVKINVEDCDAAGQGKGASFLVERLGVVIMPTLVLIRKREAIHHVRGFDELGGTTEFSTACLARLLAQHQIIFPSGSDEENSDDEGSSAWRRSSYGVNSINLNRR